jgi:MFS family permease
LLYGLGEGVFIPTLQDVVAGAAAPEQRGAVVAVWVGAARAGQTAGPLLAAGLYGATSTSTTFMVGGALAAGLVVFELVGRFGSQQDGPSPTHGARALVASPSD